jgi:branched-chain amino acid transport system permease protein
MTGRSWVVTLVQLFVSSLTLGSIYTLVAIGLVLVFKASDLINFGQGEWVLGGAYIALALLLAGLPIWAIILLAPLGGAVMGVVIDRLVWRRLMRSSPWVFVVGSLAVGGLIREIVVYEYQSNLFPFPAVFSRSPITLGSDVRVTPQNLWVVAATLLVVAALYLFFKKSRYGKALEGVAQNRVGAQIVGIDLGRSLMFTWGLSGAVSAIAAVLIAPTTGVSPELGLLVVPGFVAAALGGLDSLGGAIVGGFTVAFAQTLTAVYVSSAMSTAIVMLLLLAIMYIRPSGLFGSRAVVRL